MFNLLKIFKKSSDDVQRDEALKMTLKAKYQAFQQLLSKNNEVLSLMADMEEKLSGEYLFDRNYIRTSVQQIAKDVYMIIESLNALSGNKYSRLLSVYDRIKPEIEKTLEYKVEVPVSDLTVSLENLSGHMVGIAGGKSAHLGDVKKDLGLPTPEGFAISAYSFIKFMDHNKLQDRITEKLETLRVENLDELNAVSKEIQDMVIRSDIPEDLQQAIQSSYDALVKKNGIESIFSVRSSAIREDSEASFAGQYATFLNIPGHKILQKYKEVVASLFTPRAIFYYKTKGFSESEMIMSVGVLSMVNAVSSGVMYTKNPTDPEAEYLMINAVYGLGKWVVDGTITPDSYKVARDQEGTILEKNIAYQEKMLVCGEPGELEELFVPEEDREKQCITDEQIRVLADYGLALEKYYGFPQDIEWAIDKSGQVYILQTRLLRMISLPATSSSIPRHIEGYRIILDKGVIACKGIGHGNVFILKDEEALKDFPEGGILVAGHTSPKYVTVMEKASAILTDVGSVTGHMSSLTREYQVPTILDMEVATTELRDGQEITVDAFNCNIYEGKVDELIEYAATRQNPFKETHLYKTLKRTLCWIVPLNLTDPEDPHFTPDNCKTFHDITRFCHEVAMHEMFSTGEDHDTDEIQTINLKAGIPIDVHLLDIEGGIRENTKKAIPEDILSIPFSAILKGMKGMKWPEPRPVDAKGFLGMMAHSASVPEGELYAMGKKSFAVLSYNYMNFSIRLGYHFSMIEAYAGDNINDNYIKFFFKGGGAAIDRRLRRVRLITEILKAMGFRVTFKEDVIDAILTKYKQETIEEKLDAMGKLTAYTKQLDMVMFNDAVTDMYIDDFIGQHIEKKQS